MTTTMDCTCRDDDAMTVLACPAHGIADVAPQHDFFVSDAAEVVADADLVRWERNSMDMHDASLESRDVGTACTLAAFVGFVGFFVLLVAGSTTLALVALVGVLVAGALAYHLQRSSELLAMASTFVDDSVKTERWNQR